MYSLSLPLYLHLDYVKDQPSFPKDLRYPETYEVFNVLMTTISLVKKSDFPKETPSTSLTSRVSNPVVVLGTPRVLNLGVTWQPLTRTFPQSWSTGSTSRKYPPDPLLSSLVPR